MNNWQAQLHYDPLPLLLAAENPCIPYFTHRDLLNESVGPIHEIWNLPAPQRIVKKQIQDGSWKYRGSKKEVYPPHHYPLVETWKQFRFLIDQYEFTREHPAAKAAAEFLFSCQTDEGDIRGMIGNQYATYYTGAILSLLIKAGYQADERVEKGMAWLLSMRQKDGGWTIPILTAALSWDEQIKLTSQYADPVRLDRNQPFSHNWTGMVLRAFAAHPHYRSTTEAIKAANLLKTRFFQKDCYSSYQSADYWLKFDYPFWWNHLLAALDSISLIDPTCNDEYMKQAITWFIEHQQEDGLWNTKTYEKRLWIGLAICRVLKRLLG